jgi:uncharacterized membrane protein
MKDFLKKEIAFERIIFFSDAIVAIAITLLALNLKLEKVPHAHLMFSDLIAPWKNYVAFVLSFISIASFWKIHHDLFMQINKINEKLFLLNIIWLFLIIVLPFSTTLVSTYFGDSPAILLYTLNLFLISFVQNTIWQYASKKDDFINTETLPEQFRKRYQVMFNLDMLNGLIAVALSFFNPILAFILLYTKVPIFVAGTIYMLNKRRKAVIHKKRH